MTDSTTSLPPVPPIPAAVAPPEPAPAPAPTEATAEKVTQEELGWTLTMREETAIRRRFGDSLESLSDADMWRGCGFVQRLRAGVTEDAAYAAADALKVREARADFLPNPEETEESIAERLKILQGMLADIETVSDELTGPEGRQIKLYFADDFEDLSGWDQGRALCFIEAVRQGSEPKGAKKAVADLARRAVLEQVKTAAEAAGKGVTA